MHKVYGNTSNLTRIFAVKRAINNLQQKEGDFTKHLGKYSQLWSELEMLRPSTNDPDTLEARREKDKTFGLLLTLSPSFNDVVKHILRDKEIPCYDEVCAQLQKEIGVRGFLCRIFVSTTKRWISKRIVCVLSRFVCYVKIWVK